MQWVGLGDLFLGFSLLVRKFLLYRINIRIDFQVTDGVEQDQLTHSNTK